MLHYFIKISWKSISNILHHYIVVYARTTCPGPMHSPSLAPSNPSPSTLGLFICTHGSFAEGDPCLSIYLSIYLSIKFLDTIMTYTYSQSQRHQDISIYLSIHPSNFLYNMTYIFRERPRSIRLRPGMWLPRLLRSGTCAYTYSYNVYKHIRIRVSIRLRPWMWLPRLLH